MAAQLIDGKAIAAHIREELTQEVAQMSVQPCLAVIIVGEDPASHVYVRNKAKAAEKCGIKSFTDIMPEEAAQEALLARVRELNTDDSVHGILVQLPLPEHMDATTVINTIAPEKDVDGFHVTNAGKLATGQEALVPCTPQGCMIMLKQQYKSLSGLHAAVLGRSNIVGKPMVQLLLSESCTVTICHSRTKDIAAEVKRADIVIAAVGHPKMVPAQWIKPGATVIDVGINRTEEGKLVGDVDFDNVKEVAGAITPVPGGVGPMTIACLLKNTVKAVKI